MAKDIIEFCKAGSKPVMHCFYYISHTRSLSFFPPPPAAEHIET